MNSYTNIREEGQRPLLINTSSISVLIEHEENEKRNSKGTLVLNALDQGQFLYGETESWNLDTDYVVEQIENSGTSLFTIPFYWGDQEKIGRYFVNPELVQSIIISGERTSEGDSEPHVGLLADVRGYGRVETYKVPVSVANEFVKAVEAVNPNMMRFDPETASTRWGPEGFTMIDPAQVRNIFPNGYDIDIQFKDGMRLDFHLDRGNKVSDASQEYLNQLYNRLKAENGGEFKDLNSLMPEISKFERGFRRQLREDFAAALAAKVPDIVHIEDAEDVYYTTLDQIAWINTFEDSVSVHFKKAATQRYEDSMNIHFKDEQTATAQMQRLTDIASGNSPALKPGR